MEVWCHSKLLPVNDKRGAGYRPLAPRRKTELRTSVFRQGTGDCSQGLGSESETSGPRLGASTEDVYWLAPQEADTGRCRKP